MRRLCLSNKTCQGEWTVSAARALTHSATARSTSVAAARTASHERNPRVQFVRLDIYFLKRRRPRRPAQASEPIAADQAERLYLQPVPHDIHLHRAFRCESGGIVRGIEDFLECRDQLGRRLVELADEDRIAAEQRVAAGGAGVGVQAPVGP